MSLRDTINGAREEAAKANAPLAKKDDKDEKDAAGDSERTGFSKRSVSRAKPAREAAAGVRVVSAGSSAGKSSASSTAGKTPVEMTKDEKKRARQERRTEQDRRTSASQILLHDTPGYKKSQKVWWGLLGAGFACTIVSWLIPNVYPKAVASSAALNVVLLILLILAYGLIIAAFVYDWRIVRPMRKKAEATTNRMTNKKVTQVLRGEANEIAREQAERDEAKAARRAKRNQRHEQHK
jgi:membrane protein implicated in regulation of membrane protease activity